MKRYRVCVLGGGPAGLAAAASAADENASVLIVEREKKLGGILKQCIHDGFGLIHFKERLTGPEYAERYIKDMIQKDVDYITSSFVTDVKKLSDGGFELELQTQEGMEKVESDTIVLACGCRERTSRQVFVHGDRPAGIYTAGTAQYFVNIMGYMPTKKCVIIGSGDIGMIMARRLTLEGAQVEGVYEIKDAPAGLDRNVAQCLDDYNIPLHLSTTVTQVFGNKRVEAVEVCQVDKKFNPIKETARIIECDSLILSVGLLPENEIADKLGIEIDNATKGPLVDQTFMTNVPGVFSCGNALHVNDLVDYVSENASLTGKYAAIYQPSNRTLVKINYSNKDFLYVVPQYYDSSKGGELNLYFRAQKEVRNHKVAFLINDEVELDKTYKRMLPSEMEAVKIKTEKTVEHAALRMGGPQK
ncbi:MAG: NAD(P)/FAD-dependent oxidoreductase [Oscillospiraceae bacterium]|jgi:thioredoxin reductase|nr:NAD(P)/FAD-dependent oxidoreductase [Oscillospiraceae bacterium]